MRILLYTVLFLLLFQTSFAAVLAPGTVIDHSLAKPPKKEIYEKGKGTLGLVAGLALGPVGLLSVHLLSHNRTMRKKADQGCEIWATVVVVAAFCWLIVFAAGGHGGHSGHGGRGAHGGKVANLHLGEGLVSTESKRAGPGQNEREIPELPLFLQP